MQKRREASKKQKRSQNYKTKCVNQNRSQEIKSGLVGFLVTCDQYKEKRAVKELYNLLNDYTEKVHPDLDLDELFEEHKRKEQEAQAIAKAR